MIYDLASSDRLPLADAEQLAARYGKCIVCGAALKAAKRSARPSAPCAASTSAQSLDDQKEKEAS